MRNMFHYKNYVIFYDIYSCYLSFFTMDSDLEKKMHFTNLTNPKNPNLILDSTDYAASCL